MAIDNTHTKLVKIKHVFLEMCSWTERQINKNGHHNTPQPFLGQRN